MRRTLIWHLATEANGSGRMPPPHQHRVTSAGALLLADRSDEDLPPETPVRKVSFSLAGVGKEMGGEPVTERILLQLISKWFEQVDRVVSFTGTYFCLPVLTCRSLALEIPLDPVTRDPEHEKHVDVQRWLQNRATGSGPNPGFDFICNLLELPPRAAPQRNGAQLPVDCLFIALAYLRIEYVSKRLDPGAYVKWIELLQAYFCSQNDAFAAFF